MELILCPAHVTGANRVENTAHHSIAPGF